MQILIAAVILGALGLIFGAVIFVASKYLSVPTDPKRDAVRECLPGANCGGCGFAGCDSYADAIAAGKAAPNLCPVGGDAVAGKIAEIIGVSAEKAEREVATVICRGSTERCRIKFNYEGIHDCRRGRAGQRRRQGVQVRMSGLRRVRTGLSVRRNTH